MNVEVENLPNCMASLRIELPPERVTQEWNEVVKGFRKFAKIPGFRPGKAPQSVVEAKFRKQIQDELTRKLISQTTRQAIREKGLNVLSISEVDDVEFTTERRMRFTATVITTPEFELPEYKGIAIKVPPTEVNETELEGALQNLRERNATFTDIDSRPLEKGDFAVIDYETILDGQPLSDAVPNAPKMLGAGKDFWIKVEENALLKGFSEALVGSNIGQTLEFDLTVPEGYPVSELIGKTLHFQVTLKAIKQMQLPEVDDAFANQVVQGFDLGKLKETLRTRLGEEKLRRVETIKRNQIVDQLLSRVECELPPAYVKDEARRIMSEIVQQNQMRGVSEEILRENQKDIINAASRNAKDRVKANFILTRIAQAEGIEVNADELKERVQELAAQYRMTFEKMRTELEEKGAIPQVREEILIGKVLDFLTSNANIETSSEAVANR
ncbi:MAG: trigger factor [Chthoniobacterales bacterium]